MSETGQRIQLTGNEIEALVEVTSAFDVDTVNRITAIIQSMRQGMEIVPGQLNAEHVMLAALKVAAHAAAVAGFPPMAFAEAARQMLVTNKDGGT